MSQSGARPSCLSFRNSGGHSQAQIRSLVDLIFFFSLVSNQARQGIYQWQLFSGKQWVGEKVTAHIGLAGSCCMGPKAQKQIPNCLWKGNTKQKLLRRAGEGIGDSVLYGPVFVSHYWSNFLKGVVRTVWRMGPGSQAEPSSAKWINCSADGLSWGSLFSGGLA